MGREKQALTEPNLVSRWWRVEDWGRVERYSLELLQSCCSHNECWIQLSQPTNQLFHQSYGKSSYQSINRPVTRSNQSISFNSKWFQREWYTYQIVFHCIQFSREDVIGSRGTIKVSCPVTTTTRHIAEQCASRCHWAESCFTTSSWCHLKAAGSGSPCWTRLKNLNFSPISDELVSSL